MKPTFTRRKFLSSTAMAGTAIGLSANPFYILKDLSPSNTITVAVMGLRSRGNALAKGFAALENCDVAYLCDVDDRYYEKTIKDIAPLQDRKPQLEKDIRKILEDPSIDAIAIAAPDHWHAPAAIMACQAGKHVYVEKPCSHNPREGELLVEAARKYNRVVQMGNQRRSWSNVQACIRDIHSGVIGNVYFAKGWYTNTREPIGFGKATAVPSHLDFDLWQGPAPRRAYRDNIHPYNWHWFWHWGTGEALNNGVHFIDLMRWGLELNYPTQVSSAGGRLHYNDDWQTPDTQTITLSFEKGKMISWESRSCNSYPLHDNTAGIVFHGEGGSIVLGSGNAYTVYDNSRKPKVIKEVKEEANKDDQPNSRNTMGPGNYYDAPHFLNFLEGIRKGTSLRSEIEGGHKSTLLCQLGNIAYRTQRTLNIDQRNGRIIGDTEAMKLWSREYEPGWEVNVL